MSCTIAYKLCTAFSILTFESVVDFRNLLKDIYNSLFLIQVKHDLWNYLFLHILEKRRVNRVPCLVWHYCASHNVCCDCEMCSISEIIKTCTVFKSTFMKYLILTTVKKEVILSMYHRSSALKFTKVSLKNSYASYRYVGCTLRWNVA